MSVRLCRLVAVFLLLPLATLRAQVAGAPDWEALTREAVTLLSEYIRINTSNPPGNELAGAQFLERVLQREGIEAQILDTAELGPGRANLYARLKGSGSKRAVALVHHIDVVPADARFWSVDPFGGVVKEGYVWGRGAIDFKGQGITHLVAMLALKRSGVPLNRDVVFIANADEEMLGIQGAAVFMQRHADLMRDVEYVINEGAWNRVENGRLLFYSVAVAEKLNFSQRLTVTGTPGHGSRPNADNPAVRLISALDAIRKFEAPLTVTPIAEHYFKSIAPMYSGEERRWLEDIGAAIRDERARARILSDPSWHAYLRNTVQITVLRGSEKTNLVPAEASAELDIRLLPGTDTAAFMESLKKAVADPRISWTRVFPVKSNLASPMETDLMKVVERVIRERTPGAIIAPILVPGGTDMPWLRALGATAYGVDPFLIERSEQQRGLHGNDERVPVTSVRFGVQFIYDLIRALQ